MQDEIKTYFPQPGDSSAVSEQKRVSRLNAQKQFEMMAGPGADSAVGRTQQQNQNQTSTVTQPRTRWVYNSLTGKLEEQR